MDHPKGLTAAVALGALALATACTQVQALRASLRDPGESNLDLPEAVADEYHCDKRPLPFVQVEEYQVLPDRVKPGGELSHRLEYVMCPRHRTEVIPGTLTTRVLFRGRVIVTDAVRYELKPGRWRKDQSIELPGAAVPGVYSLDLEFEPAKSSAGGDFHFLEQKSFIVRSVD